MISVVPSTTPVPTLKYSSSQLNQNVWKRKQSEKYVPLKVTNVMYPQVYKVGHQGQPNQLSWKKKKKMYEILY